MSDFSLTVLGSRGSIPVHGAKFQTFGGATSSYLIETEHQAIFLDAGSGIATVDVERLAGKEISIFISHPHLDHLLGLPFFPPLLDENRRIELYGEVRYGMTLRETIDRLFNTPYWPIRIEDYPSDVVFPELKFPLVLTDVTVDGIEVPHPGSCTAYRFTYAGKKIVCLSDCELREPRGTLLSFVRDVDLLLIDSQYTDEEYETRKGFGHSTESRAISWKEAAGAKRLLLIHHDPLHDDEFLLAREAKIDVPNVSYARVGETITL